MCSYCSSWQCSGAPENTPLRSPQTKFLPRQSIRCLTSERASGGMMYDSDIHLNHRLLLCFIPSYLNKIPPLQALPLLFAIPYRKPLQQPVWKKGETGGTTPKILLYIRFQVQKCPAHKSGLSNSFCPAPWQWITNQNHHKGDSAIAVSQSLLLERTGQSRVLFHPVQLSVPCPSPRMTKV